MTSVTVSRGHTSDISSEPRKAKHTAPDEPLIFICYSRRVVADVEKFHRVLEERLQARKRSYRIFRDKGPGENERIITGDHWRTVLRQKLDEAHCCLVILVPDIFQSDECALEIEQFKARIDRNEQCLFFPIAFLSVDKIMSAGTGENRIVDALTREDRHDFTALWHEEESSPAYRKAVDEIAQQIDIQVDRKLGPPPEEDTPEESRDKAEPPPRRQGRWLAMPPAVVLIMATIWFFQPPSVEWRPRDGPLELVLPTLAYADKSASEPMPELLPPQSFTGVKEAKIDNETWYSVNDGSAYIRAKDVADGFPLKSALDIVMPVAIYSTVDSSEPLPEPLPVSQISAGRDDVERIVRVTWGGENWYLIDRSSKPPIYVKADDVPEWEAIDEQTEPGLLNKVEVYREPRRTAEATWLHPDDSIADVRRATIAGESWLRMTGPTGDVFAPEPDVAGSLLSWSAIPDTCLRGQAAGSAYSFPVVDGDRPLNDFSNGTVLTRGEPIQSAMVEGKLWYRYIASNQKWHVPATSVETVACQG